MTVINLHEYPDGPPVGVVRIDRFTRYGNPFHLARYKDRSLVIRMYRDYIKWVLENLDSEFLDPLRGKTLACWCKPAACHGDVIQEILNEL